MLGTILESLDKELDNVKIVKINVDEHPEVAAQYGVVAIPTMNLYSGGTIVKTITGAKPKQAILSEIEDYI